jgi:hypothetical protein
MNDSTRASGDPVASQLEKKVPAQSELVPEVDDADALDARTIIALQCVAGSGASEATPPDTKAPSDRDSQPAVARAHPLDARTIIALQRLTGNATVTRHVMRARVGPPYAAGRASPLVGSQYARPGHASIQRQNHSGPDPAVPAPSGGDSETEERYRFDYQGRTCVMTKAELNDFKSQLTNKLRDGEGFSLKNKYLLLVDNWGTIRLLNEQHRVISWFCEYFSGGALDDGVLDTAQAQVEEAWAALDGNDIVAATERLALAEAAVNEAVDHHNTYMNALYGGGETTITLLEITQTAAFAVASVAGGAALMAATEVGVVAASAISGGGTALLGSLATHVPQAIGGEEKIGEAAIKIILDTGLNAAGAALAAKVLPGVTEKLTAKIASSISKEVMAKLGENAVRQRINDALVGGLGNVIQGIFGDLRGLVTSETTWVQFIEHIVTNLVAGGIMGAFAAKMPWSRTDHAWNKMVGRAGDPKVELSPRELERILDDVQKGLEEALASAAK